mgnify:CR=1 FL=1
MFNDYTINELNTLQFAITIILRHISSCLQSLISLCLQIVKKNKVRVQTSQKDTEQAH